MKRYLSALLALSIIAVSFSFVVAAQGSDENAASEQTREQARLMVTSHGAKVRLLQLEYALQRQVSIGERIMQKATEMSE